MNFKELIANYFAFFLLKAISFSLIYCVINETFFLIFEVIFVSKK